MHLRSSTLLSFIILATSSHLAVGAPTYGYGGSSGGYGSGNSNSGSDNVASQSNSWGINVVGNYWVPADSVCVSLFLETIQFVLTFFNSRVMDLLAPIMAVPVHTTLDPLAMVEEVITVAPLAHTTAEALVNLLTIAEATTETLAHIMVETPVNHPVVITPINTAVVETIATLARTTVAQMLASLPATITITAADTEAITAILVRRIAEETLASPLVITMADPATTTVAHHMAAVVMLANSLKTPLR